MEEDPLRFKRHSAVSPANRAVNAIDNRDASALNSLRAGGEVSVDHRVGNGESLLHVTARTAAAQCILVSLDAGANPCISDPNGSHPLHYAGL